MIVGGGGTGLAAAIEAANAGSSVLVLEKDSKTGGSTAMSGGVIQVAGTSFQKKYTSYQDDTPENHAMTWIVEGEGLVDEELVKDLASGAPENIEWLVSLGMDYVSVYGQNHVPYLDRTDYFADRIHVPAGEGGGAAGSGSTQTNALKAKCDELGVTFVLNKQATSLVYEKDRGVIGVAVDDELYKAKRAVILATAGIDRGDDLAKALCPQIACIYVNGQAQRFVCEDATYAYMNRAIFEQNKMWDAPCWMIMDADGVLGSPTFNTQELVDEKVKDGTLVKADTIAALAKAIDLSADNLAVTLDRWNTMIATDGKDVDYLRNTQNVKITKAPFYAMKLIPYNLGSCGGIKTNIDCQVLDLAGNVIPHLFAGGLCQGGWIGPYYPGSGTAVAGTVHWGRKCGKNAAATEAWETSE